MTSLKTLAVANYRSIRSLFVPLGDLTLVTGANGSGKSNLYRALRLLSEAAQGGIVASLAKEGGLASTLWAGPEQFSRRMKSGEIPIQGGPRTRVVALRHVHLSIFASPWIYFPEPKPMHSQDVAGRETLVDARLINRLLCRDQQCLGFLPLHRS